MPREQLNTPMRRVITTPRSEREDPGNPGTFFEGNGLQPGEWAMRWAVDGEPLRDGDHWENTPTLFLGWSKIADGLDPDMLVYIEVDADEVLRAADAIQRNKEATGFQQNTWMFSTVRLTRDEAQAIVRVARRARDAVFGGDE